MTTPKIALPVDREGYSVQNGNNVIRTELEGGPSRFRLDSVGAPHIVNVQWSTNLAGYEYLMAFFRTGINYGASPFLIDLIIDTEEADEYTAHLIPGSFGLRSQSGLSYVVGAQLEVEAIAANATADQDIIDAFEED